MMKCKVLTHLNNLLSTEGIVVKGYGRGSKELGIRTANYDSTLVDQLPPDFKTGVYYGWAQVDKGDIHKCVINVGWCPFYLNKRKSFETHIMNNFDDEFYGSILRVLVAGYIRPEMDFVSLESLIQMIRGDIDFANEQLQSTFNQNIRNSFADYF